MSAASMPALAALLVFALCLFGAAPSAYWLDSAELGAAAFELGIPHPPGHPAYALTTKAVTLLPLGNIPLRASLASALALALAAAVLSSLLGRVAKNALGWESAARAPLAAGVAVTACASYSAAFQGVRAEVYALNLALLLAATYLTVRFGEGDGDGRREGEHPPRVDVRFFYLAALVLGLALANHHLLVLLGAFPLAVYALVRAPAGLRARVVSAGLAAVFLGLSAYAYLPLRADRAPLVGWGDPVRAERFGWVVSARAFQKSLAPKEDASLAGNALTLAGITMEALTPVGVPLGLVGLFLLARRRRALGVALVGAMLATLASQLTMPADPHNPDVHGYLLFAIALLAGGAYWLLAALAAGFHAASARGIAHAGLVLAIALPALQTSRSWNRFTLADFHAAEDVTRPLLRDLPVGAVALTSYFQSIFFAWHARLVEGERPDVTVLHRHFLSYPGYGARESAREPALAPLLASYSRGTGFGAAAFASLAHERPLLVEPDLDLQPDLAGRYRPVGWLGTIDNLGAVNEDDLALRLRRDAFWQRMYRIAGVQLHESETRRFFLWKHFVEANAAQRAGLAALAVEEAKRGLVLSPQSPELLGIVTADGRFR